MKINFIALFIAALSTLVVGYIWYHPRVFGKIWMKEAGVTEQKMKPNAILPLIGISLVYAFLISMVLQFLVIHQFGASSMTGGDTTKALPSYAAFMNDYGTAFRTFKHGALHGFLASIFMILPIIGTNSLFERKSFKYTLLSSGFWIISFTIMGGIICAWT